MTLLLLLSADEELGGDYVVSFPQLTPAPRFDGTPWNSITVEEAATIDGPYAVLVDKATLAVDADPGNPQLRAITVVGATLPAAWYRVTFFDANGEADPHPPVRLGISFKPSVVDVGTLLHARTTVLGTEQGTFNADTIATGPEVQTLIDFATDSVIAAIGTDETVPALFWGTAQRLIALLAATLVEASFFSNQINTDRSPYQQYTAMYTAGLPVLVESIKAYGQGSAPGVADDVPAPTFAFPAACAAQLDHAFSTVPVVSPWQQWGWPDGVAPPG